MQHFKREQLEMIVRRLQKGGALIEESRRLGFQSNGPLRAALKEYMGVEKYNALMEEKRPKSRTGESILPAAAQARQEAAMIEIVKLRLATIRKHEFTHNKGKATTRILADGKVVCDCAAFRAGLDEKLWKPRQCQHVHMLTAHTLVTTDNKNLFIAKMKPKDPKNGIRLYSRGRNKSYKRVLAEGLDLKEEV